MATDTQNREDVTSKPQGTKVVLWYAESSVSLVTQQFCFMESRGKDLQQIPVDLCSIPRRLSGQVD